MNLEEKSLLRMLNQVLQTIANASADIFIKREKWGRVY
jgi:hypothetical protein